MPRVFGTDGVRGLANREVTAELALDLSVAAARVIMARGDVRPGPRATPRRGRPRPADLGPDPRARRRGGAGLGRGRRAPAPGGPDAGRRLPHRRPRRRPRRGHQCLAQPDARQRHQVPRPRWPQAGRRRRGPDRGADGQRVGRAHRRRRGQGAPVRTPDRGVRRPPADHAGPLAHRAQGRRRLRQRRRHRGRADGAASGGRRRRGDRCRTRRPQHQRGLRLHLPRPAAGGRGRARGRRRHRPRRRRGPLPGRRPRGPRHRRRPAARHHRPGPGRGRPARGRHRRGHRDEQPRLRAGDGGGRAAGAADPGR